MNTSWRPCPLLHLVSGNLQKSIWNRKAKPNNTRSGLFEFTTQITLYIIFSYLYADKMGRVPPGLAVLMLGLQLVTVHCIMNLVHTHSRSQQMEHTHVTSAQSAARGQESVQCLPESSHLTLNQQPGQNTIKGRRQGSVGEIARSYNVDRVNDFEVDWRRDSNTFWCLAQSSAVTGSTSKSFTC